MFPYFWVKIFTNFVFMVSPASSAKLEQPRHSFEKADTESVTVNQKLLVACRKADFQTIKALIDAGADVNCTDKYHNTPLILFLKVGLKARSRKDTLEIVRLLSDNGADLEARNQHHESAMKLAIISGNMQLIEFLIEQGANIKEEEQVVPALVLSSDYKMIELLASYGVSLNAVWNDNPSMIHAYQHKDYKMVNLLLELGANPCVKGMYHQTVLMWAASSQDFESFNAILTRCGPEEVKARNQTQHTALHWAARVGRADHVELLLESGAELEATSEDGQTALHEASMNRYPFAVPDQMETTAVLLEAGANVNAVDDSGKTPLIEAAEYGFPDVIGQLVSAGADIFHLTKDGRSASGIMASRGHTEAIKELCAQKLNAGEENVLQHEPTSVIVEAIDRNNPETAHALLDCGASIEMPDRGGVTPVMAAASKDNAHDVLLRLIEIRAEVDAQSDSGETAMKLL